MDAAFNDPDGGETSLAEFAGRPVLLNLWATWCAPCVKELPTLDRLAAEQERADVLAVSQDSGPHASVEAFLASHKIVNLGAYQDSQSSLSGALGPDTVLPTTILFDAKGKEVWRYVGDLDWTSPEAARLIAEGGRAAKKLSSRPSIAARPKAMSARPRKSCGARVSPRNSPPRRIAVGGTSSVTSKALVAPAESISRK